MSEPEKTCNLFEKMLNRMTSTQVNDLIPKDTTDLCLSGNFLEPGHLERIRLPDTLIVLDLSGNDMDCPRPDGLLEINWPPALQELDLFGNRLDEAFIAKLRKKLPTGCKIFF